MPSLHGIFQGAFGDDLVLAAGTAACLGVLFHLAVHNIEFEQYMFHFIVSFVVSFFALFYAASQFNDKNIIGALTYASLSATSFIIALLASIAVYRLFFHRCGRFPGPLGAKLTRFYAASLSAKNVQYYKEVAKMHQEYGDFVRTGPREISVLRKSAVSIVYGPKSECRKSTLYGQTGNDPRKASINSTRDHDSHRLRRRAWDRGFSIKDCGITRMVHFKTPAYQDVALSTYEPRIKTKTNDLLEQLKKLANKPVNITTWSMFFSFDVMGEVGFSKDFNNLVTGVEHPAIQGLHAHMKILGILSTVPWLMYLLSCMPGAAAGYFDFFNFCTSEIRSKEAAWDPEAYPQDIVSWLLKAVKEKDVSASPSPEALEDDSRVVIIAGSETTATTLAGALFFMAKYPEKQRKLQRLLDETIPEYNAWSYEKVKAVTYLDDWINETLRLRPALLNGGARETPVNGIQVDEVHIPGKTNVFVPTLLIQTDERWWQQATEFVPERFGEEWTEMGTEGAPYLPFSMGAYSCPGKNLALMSLRIALSAIACTFDVSFAPGETGEHFEEGMLDTFTVTLPPLHLRFTPRKQ